MKTQIVVEIDGNDGTGKSFLIKHLNKEVWYNSNLGKYKDIYDITFQDRGRLSEATLGKPFEKEKDHIYVLLDGSVEFCQKNILLRGDSIEQKWHTREDLTYYRPKFINIAREHDILIIDSEKFTIKEKIKKVIQYIKYYF